MTRVIDRAKATKAEVDAAIAEAVRSGEGLMIEDDGKPRMQIAGRQRIVGYDEDDEVNRLRLENARLRFALESIRQHEQERGEHGSIYNLFVADGALGAAVTGSTNK